MCPIKRKAVHTLVLFHIFINFLDRIGSQLVTTSLILVNLQAVAVGENCCFTEKSGGNFCRLPADKGNTVALTGSLKGIFILICLSVYLIHKWYQSFSISWIIRKLILVIMPRTGNKCCTAEKNQNNPASQKPNQTNPALHQVIRA